MDLRAERVAALEKIEKSARALIAKSSARTPVAEQLRCLVGLPEQLALLVRLRPELKKEAGLSVKADELAFDCADVIYELVLAGRIASNTESQLRELCISCIRLHQSDIAGILLRTFAEILRCAPEQAQTCLRDVELLACLSLKEQQPNITLGAVAIVFEGMLLTDRGANFASEQEHMGAQILESVAVMASRLRYEKVTREIVRGAHTYANKRGQVLDGGAWSGLVLNLLFAVAQGRLAGTTKDAGELAVQLARQEVPRDALKNFFADWMLYTVQLAKRDWLDIAQAFMRSQCLLLCRLRDLDLTQAAFANLSSHFVMLCKWEGTVAASAAYAPWFKFGCVLCDVCIAAERCRTAGGNDGNLWLDAKATRKLARVFIGTFAMMLTNAARLTYQEALPTYKSWLESIEAVAGANEHKRKKMRRLAQLVARYWRGTQPGSSRSQWMGLQKFLFPNMLNENCEMLLREII